MSETDTTAPIVLRPLRITTITLVVVGVLFAALSPLFVLGPLSLEWSDPTGDKSDLSFLFGLPLSVPLLVIGLFFIIRTPRMKLVLTNTDATLYTLFRTYRISRKLVTGTGGTVNINGNITPGIEWKNPKSTESGRAFIKVPFLAPAAVGNVGRSQLDAMTRILSDWCDQS